MLESRQKEKEKRERREGGLDAVEISFEHVIKTDLNLITR